MNTTLLLVARLCDYNTSISASFKNITDLAKKELPDAPVTQEDLEALVDSGHLQRKGMTGYKLLSPCVERLIPSSDALYRMVLVYLSARWDTPMDYESMRSLLLRSLRITPQHLRDPDAEDGESPLFDAAYWKALERLEGDGYLWRHNSGWALTETGDQQAFLIQGKNITTWWIERHKEEIYKTAPGYIQKRLNVDEQKRHDGLEIVNDYLTTIMGRDTFRERLLGGGKVRVCNLRQFCFQHYLGSLRRASKDGLQRAMSPHYKTRKEMNGTFVPMKSDHDVLFNYDNDGGWLGFDIIAPPTAEDSLMTQDILIKAKNILGDSPRGNTDLPDMLSWLAEGKTLPEISMLSGKTAQARRNQANIVKNTVNRLLLE